MRSRELALAVFVSGAALTGCPADDESADAGSEDGGPERPLRDVGVDGDGAVAAFRQQVEDLVCSEISTCCTQLGVGFNETRCRQASLFEISGDVFDSERAEDCLRRLRQALGACVPSATASEALQEICSAVVTRSTRFSRLVGESCAEDEDCMPSSKGEVRCITIEGRAVCQEIVFVSLGEVCATGVASARWCKGEVFCDDSSATPTCQPTSSESCAQVPCTFPQHCEDADQCSLPGQGFCTTWRDCEAGTHCEAGCVDRRPSGMPCTKSLQCTSLRCVAGQCASAEALASESICGASRMGADCERSTDCPEICRRAASSADGGFAPDPPYVCEWEGWTLPAQCISDADCADIIDQRTGKAYSCDTRFESQEALTCRTCAEDRHCPRGWICADFACAKPCETDEDCGGCPSTWHSCPSRCGLQGFCLDPP